tara:strand:- start:581 stop:1060 length:480 start_codon:yes stop_codon:yes gene_type:complete
VKELTAEQLKECLSYCPETGVFTWLKTTPRGVKGTEAGTVNDNGYRKITINYHGYRSHRLAFLYMTGKWPEQQVDHINGNRLDNRWENLRDVSRLVNIQNQLGKGYHKFRDGWRAQIRTNSKIKSLGVFKTEEEASAAYIAAKHIYHAEAMERKDGKTV